MKFGSVCSGIEAASAAWNPLGWEAAWFSEIEAFPCAVLAHHHPGVPNHGDMTTLPDRIRAGEVEAPDLFCGGTPCQAFSVAGQRKSLDDARGNLSLTFCEIGDAIDDIRHDRGEQPCIIFWENVPGVLSTADNAFGCFLAQLVGGDEPLYAPDGWPDAGCVSGQRRTAAWRVLDAQYFGLAQRRRRVFVVASARDGFDPAAVLFEFNGVRRDIAPSRETREIAPTIPARSTAGGGLGTDFDCDGGVIAMAHGQGGAEIGFNRSPTLTCIHEAPIAAYPSIAHTLRGEGFDASEDGTGRGTPLVAFHPTQDPISSTNVCHTIGANKNATAAVMQPVALPINTMIATRHNKLGESTGFGIGDETDPAFTLTKGHSHAVAIGTDCYNQAITGDVAATIGTPGSSSNASGPTVMQVRRLTPVECERLMGFPDNYTAIPYRKKPASECPDGPRYKALGNSWAVPVVAWIGKRINNYIKETA